MNDTGNRIIAGIVVVLIVIAAWYLGTTFKPGTGTKTASTSTSETTATSSNTTKTTTTSGTAVNVSGEAVSVGNQPAGSFVVISSVTLPHMGWVAVRDANGRTLGAARFEAGTYAAVQVPLLRNTISGERYQILLYIDDGDKAFDLHKDTLVMNADGTVAGATFTALNGD